jgi:tetratricopeptide (TPR) repeat protein
MNDLYKLLDHAIKLHGSGDLTGAEQLYTGILSADSTNFTALHLLGVIRAQQGRNAEALPLMEAAIRSNPRSASALTNRGNVLMSLGRQQEALESYDGSLALQADAETLFNRAVALQALCRFQESVAAYDALLSQRPDHAQAWANRGNALHELRRYPEALASYDQALRAMPANAQILTNRSISLWMMNDFLPALENVDQALRIDPRQAGAWSHRGNVLRALDRPDEALASFDHAIALNREDADAYLNKSYCLLLAGRWQEGWPLFEWRKRLPVPVEFKTFAQPLWTGKENLGDKTLFCYVGQGLGDTIQFFRYCALAQDRGAHVILAPQTSLMRLLKRGHPGVELIPQDEIPPHFDYHLPLMSLPLAFHTIVDSIPETGPYLEAEAPKVREWSTKIGDRGFKIGIVWRGNDRGMLRGKNFSPVLLGKIAKLPGVRLLSLQKDATAEELSSTAPAIEALGAFDQGSDAFIDSAAVMRNLDLVITADTAIAHLAGALGVRTWIALQYLPDWRWLLGRSDTPWYRSVTLYRQPRQGDWAGVFDQMERDLAALLPNMEAS